MGVNHSTKGHKSISLKWYFKTRKKLMQGLDTIRLLLAIAVIIKWDEKDITLDVKSAFLHGDLKEEVKLEANQLKGVISIKQSAYANKILKEAGMIDCNETLIPMDPEPREQHMKAIRQVLRYVKGTKDYGITYKHNGGNKIHGFLQTVATESTLIEGKGTTGLYLYIVISEMSKFYTYIWNEMSISKQKIVGYLHSQAFIFVPYSFGSKLEKVSGLFLSPNEVYWHDSTGLMKQTKSTVAHSPFSKMLCNIYPDLQFLRQLGVSSLSEVVTREAIYDGLSDSVRSAISAKAQGLHPWTQILDYRASDTIVCPSRTLL
ncbi:ribonuclease H-like domain, reverse transcriptase, RNA-dependent DNA polymerase [Tanacetum coccineum]|uniref:Ribonuclease H-like domain, reverse transcriptase, RNA-dependent DNA polymerase n=1 Tax=Tanacetum coccineum TaxID=301880 RepID=A0ABQ5CTY7_9ASTR